MEVSRYLKIGALAAGLTVLALAPSEYDSLAGFRKPGLCSGYATRMADRKYHKEFERGDAWNLKYHNEVFDIKDSSLEQVIFNANEGDILAIYYPDSPNNTARCGKMDEKGNPREYTHVALYDGLNDGEPQIDHNFKGPRREPLRNFLIKYKCIVKKIIKPRKNE